MAVDPPGDGDKLGAPGLRELEVLRGVGQNAIVASICARNVGNIGDNDFGYRPALRALLNRLSEGLL